MGVMPVRPLVLGFIRASGLEARDEIELTGQLAAWAHREGYLLGVTYREQPGNGAFEALLQAIKIHDAVGVAVPSFEYLGPMPEARVGAIRERSGASVYAVSPTPARGQGALDEWSAGG
jgi:hypothetical protein